MEHNTIVNRYLSDNERYAYLINGCEFGGEQIVAAKDLQDIDTQVNASMESRKQSTGEFLSGFTREDRFKTGGKRWG